MSEHGEVQIEGQDPLKIVELCDELETHNISLCAISEHRWKHGGTYSVNERWTFVFSGVLEDDAKAQKGVGFQLNQDMTRAWRAADSFCEYGGGRLLKIRLKLRNRYFTLVSCYAPTYRCSDAEKESFYSDLGTMLDDVESRDELLLMGDFNARGGVAAGQEEAGMEVLGDAVGGHQTFPTILFAHPNPVPVGETLTWE